MSKTKKVILPDDTLSKMFEKQFTTYLKLLYKEEEGDVEENYNTLYSDASYQDWLDEQYEAGASDNSELPGSCGINVLCDLRVAASVNDQLLSLYSVLQDKGQVVLSDVVNSPAWKETKAVSYHGPITNNPNSGNKIQIYIITRACLPELVKYLPKRTYDKYFK